MRGLTGLKKMLQTGLVALCVFSVYVFGLTETELLIKNQELLIKNQELDDKGKKLDYRTIGVVQLIAQNNNKAEFFNLKALVDKQNAIRDKHYTVIDKFNALGEYKGEDILKKFEVALLEFEASLKEWGANLKELENYLNQLEAKYAR